VASYQHQLGRFYLWSGRADLAEPYFRQSTAINVEFRGEEHPWTLGVRLLLADALIELNKNDEALALAQHAVVHYTKLYGERDNGTANARRITGLAMLRMGNAALAEPMLREAVDVLRVNPGSVSWRFSSAQSALGECLVALHQYEEAGPLLTSSYEWLKAHKGERFYESEMARRRFEAWREKQVKTSAS
jgi:tetratricopeptide (TPR) repeat protein